MASSYKSFHIQTEQPQASQKPAAGTQDNSKPAPGAGSPGADRGRNEYGSAEGQRRSAQPDRNRNWIADADDGI